MKPLLFSLASLALGFTAARLLPVSRPDVTTAAPVKKPATAPSQPARNLDLAGDWKPAAEAWAAEDPAGLCAWLVQRGIPPESDLHSLLFSTWAARDADAAFTAFFNLPADFRRRDMVLSDMLQAVFNKPDGWQEVFKWLPQVDEQINAYRHPGTEWTKSAPPEQMAARLLANCSSGSYSGTLIGQFARGWARQDRAAAMAWIKSLRPELHRDAFSGLMDDWAEQDPVAALDYLATKADSGERGNAFAPISVLAKKDPKAAFPWWEENMAMPDTNSLGQIFSAWCATNSMEARDYALAIEDPTLRHHALTSWSRCASTGDLLEMISKTPAGSNRSTMVETLWSKAYGDGGESAAVRDFVQAAGPDVIPVGTVAAISRGYAKQNPEAALAWVASLPEAYQAESVGFVLSAWTDKVAAALAVERLPEGPMKAAARHRLMPDPKDPFR